MKIKSLLPSRGKILNKMMFNAFKERDTILKENNFGNFLSTDYWKIPPEY